MSAVCWTAKTGQPPPVQVGLLVMRAEDLKGNLDGMLLAVLTAGPQHGYSIVEAVRERSAGRVNPRPGRSIRRCIDWRTVVSSAAAGSRSAAADLRDHVSGQKEPAGDPRELARNR